MTWGVHATLQRYKILDLFQNVLYRRREQCFHFMEGAEQTQPSPGHVAGRLVTKQRGEFQSCWFRACWPSLQDGFRGLGGTSGSSPPRPFPPHTPPLGTAHEMREKERGPRVWGVGRPAKGGSGQPGRGRGRQAPRQPGRHGEHLTVGGGLLFQLLLGHLENEL